MPGGGPSCEAPRGRARPGMPFPLGMPFGGMPRGGGCIDMRGGIGDGKAIDVGEPDGGGGPAAATVSAFGRLRLTTFMWCSIAYKVSIRGTLTPASFANLTGEPR